MTASTQWRISLPPLPSATATTTDEVFLPPEGRARPTAVETGPHVPAWLREGDPRSPDEIAVLLREAEDLLGRRIVSENPWKLVPTRNALAAGDEAVARLVARAEEDLGVLEKGRELLSSLGLPGEPGVIEAAGVIDRLSDARDALAGVAQAAERISGRKISVRDAAVLADVAPSLAAETLGAAWMAPGFPGLLDSVAALHEAVEAAAALIAAEFGFDPRAWSEAAFGGVARAFESSRAADFLLATKKLGIEVKTPAQAQRAAELFKDYFSAVGKLKEKLRSQPSKDGIAESGHLRGKMARLRLAAALRRRMSVLDVASDFVASIPDLDFSEFDDIADLVPSADAAALVRANGDIADEGSLHAFIASVSEQIALLERWRTTTARASNECGSTRWSDVVRQVRRLNDEADELRSHVSWVREACMLPLSDEELQRFLDHAAGSAPAAAMQAA